MQTEQRAFPSANGFGKNAGGWRYGELIIINDTTVSSIQTALQKQNPRIIIQRAAGYIDLTSRLTVTDASVPNNTRGDFAYIGFLSPGDGPVFRGREIEVTRTKNWMIRGINSMHGDLLASEGDSFSVKAYVGNADNQNFIVDTSSFAWGTDETLSVAGVDSTVQYCILAEGLNSSVHSKGVHGYGGLWGVKNSSAHHNLFSSFTDRSPLFQNPWAIVDPLFDFRNNAIFNWSRRATYMAQRVNLNLIKNSYKNIAGATPYYSPTRFFTFDATSLENSGSAYIYGNKHTALPSMTDDTASQRQGCGGTNLTATANLTPIIVTDTPFSIPVGLYDFDETIEQSDAIIAAKAGYRKRNSVFLRVIQEWQSGIVTKRGGVTNILGQIDSLTDVGGYPFLDTTSDPILTGPAPHYMPSWFTEKYNINPALDYMSIGDPSTMPHKFIFFEQGVPVNYTTLPQGYDWANTIHYHVIEVLSFEVTGEISLLTGEVVPEPEPPIDPPIDPPTIPPVLEGVRFCRIQEPIV